MKEVKNLLLTSLSGALMLMSGYGVSIVAGSVEPSLNNEYMNQDIFRPWSEPLMNLYWLVPFVTAAILLWIWNKTKSVVSGDTSFQRGISFGFSVWIISLPGMIISYSTFQLSFGIVLSWTIGGLVQYIVAGVIYARFRP